MTVITEEQFSQQVEDLLNIGGWRWCHFRPAQTEKGWRTALSGHKGFPDYIATRDSRLLIFELKSVRGKLSPDQEAWLESLRGCRRAYLRSGETLFFEVYLWRPKDFDEIVQILER